MTNDEFKEMYQEYNDELYHSWVTSLDPVKRAAQQAKQKAYNAAYYLRNKAKWLKYNARKNFQAHNENWGRGADMIREGNRRLQSGIEARLNKLTGLNRGYDSISPEQLNARETASRNKAARYQRTNRARRRYEQARNRQRTAARQRAMNAAYNQAANTREPLRRPSASAQARNAFTSAYEALMPWKKKKR